MRVNIYLPDQVEFWLREKAQTEYRSLSNFIQTLIEREREKEKVKGNASTPYK